MTPSWVWRTEHARAAVLSGLQDVHAPRPESGRSVESIVAENARLHGVLGACPRPLAVVDRDGLLVGFNRELAIALLGVPVLGEPLDALFADDDREILTEIVRGAREGNRAAGILRLAGQRGELELIGAAVPGEADEPAAVVLTGDVRGADDVEVALPAAVDLRAAYELGRGAALDGATSPSQRGRCDVSEVVRSVARNVLTVSGRRRVILQLALEERLVAAIDASTVAACLRNVIASMVRSLVSRHGIGMLRLGTEESGQHVEVRVIESGVSIDPARAVHVPQRDDDDLGIAVARFLVELAGGGLDVVDDGQVRLRLQRATSAG